MAEDETLQSPGQQMIVTILGVGVSAMQPYVLYQTIWCIIWHLSQHLCKTTVYCHCVIQYVLVVVAFGGFSVVHYVYLRNSTSSNNNKNSPADWTKEELRDSYLCCRSRFGIIMSLPRFGIFFGELKLSEHSVMRVCRLQARCDLWYSPLQWHAFCDCCVATKLCAL